MYSLIYIMRNNNQLFQLIVGVCALDSFFFRQHDVKYRLVAGDMVICSISNFRLCCCLLGSRMHELLCFVLHAKHL